MTPPAFLVLSLALVCSIFGTALEQAADPASEHAMDSKPIRIYDEIGDNNMVANPHMKTRTNIDSSIAKHIINNSYKETRDKVGKADDRFDEIYTEEIDNNNNVKKTVTDSNKDFTSNIDEDHVTFIKPKEIGESFYLTFHNDRIYNDDPFSSSKKRVKRQEESVDKCERFKLIKDKIQHPHNNTNKNKNYYSDISCVYSIAAGDRQVIKLTFVDFFKIEHHPTCEYDFLEIRDGKAGYANLIGKFCGDVFPPSVSSSGPFMWLKFKSDHTIEYEGFTIKVEFRDSTTSYKIPDSCNITVELSPERSGEINSDEIDKECKDDSAGHPLEVLWNIETKEGSYIFLNFTSYQLAKPNECEENVVQVYGDILEDSAKLQNYCGLIANPVSTKDFPYKTTRGNVMHVRMYTSLNTRDLGAKGTKVVAKFVEFRVLDKDEQCDEETEFNCEDNTCIDQGLKCNSYADCRLKADEEHEDCQTKAESPLNQEGILVILVIFFLILSAMLFVFLFKCIRKLYQDQKVIKEHIRQSCEDRLDDLMSDSRLMLDPGRLHRGSEPRVSLERENHANELCKQQRSISQHKKKPSLPQQTSIESEFQETRLDLDEESWRREVEPSVEHQDVKVERNGRARRSDTSKKEESIRSRIESIEEKEKKEIRDAAVGAPDTKESSCQTRESLFQTDTAPSSDGSNSNSNSRGFSTFGYSGATLVRPSPPAPLVSSTQIELLRQLQPQPSKQKKMSDRRPMSAETTRSAPDVIIVSKPIR